MASLSLSTSVPLKTRADTKESEKQRVWEVVTPEPSTPIDKCARRSRPDGVCCRGFIQEQRTLVDPDIVRDVYVLSNF